MIPEQLADPETEVVLAKKAGPSFEDLTPSEMLLRLFIVAAGIVTGTIFAVFIGMLSGLIAPPC